MYLFLKSTIFGSDSCEGNSKFGPAEYISILAGFLLLKSSWCPYFSKVNFSFVYFANGAVIRWGGFVYGLWSAGGWRFKISPSK